MRAVIIDDEIPAINELTYLLNKNDVNIIGAFTSSEEGYDFILAEKPEAVFLDIDMPQHNGLELGLQIKMQLPTIALVYITAYPQYALDAFKSYPIDYILKPIDEYRFCETLTHIKNNIEQTHPVKQETFKITCFGIFKAVTGAEEVKFSTHKSRELLAYLICNSNRKIFKDELLREIFNSVDDKKDSNNLRVTLYRLRNALMEKKISKEQILIRNDYGITVRDGSCDLLDYYKFIRNNALLNRQNIDEATRVADTIQGEILSDIDTLWANELREIVAIQAEELLMKVGLFFMETEEDLPKAEWYFNRVISLNSLSEPGYMALLDLYMQMSNILKFFYTYKAYSQILQEEFGCMPEKRFMDFYKLHSS